MIRVYIKEFKECRNLFYIDGEDNMLADIQYDGNNGGMTPSYESCEHDECEDHDGCQQIEININADYYDFIADHKIFAYWEEHFNNKQELYDRIERLREEHEDSIDDVLCSTLPDVEFNDLIWAMHESLDLFFGENAGRGK